MNLSQVNAAKAKLQADLPGIWGIVAPRSGRGKTLCWCAERESIDVGTGDTEWRLVIECHSDAPEYRLSVYLGTPDETETASNADLLTAAAALVSTLEARGDAAEAYVTEPVAALGG